MLLDGVTPEAFISLLESKSSNDYTEEQKELIKNFGTQPMFCFADPGTGKTFTAVGGLLFAELYRQIKGKNIYAMSFTNMATGELAVRHKTACERLGISSTVNFSTLHKLCTNILAENYRKLGMLNYGQISNISFAEAYRLIENTCAEWGIVVPPQSIKACIRACKTLNSALVFDQDHVESKMAFKECKIPYATFDRIRGLLFSYSLLTESIDVSDIMLYTLMLMEKFPEVSTEFKAQCKMMLIDEAQDLSLLHLRIISMLTDNPIFIGDMKQQIYAFNGACQEIVQAFFKQWPDAKTVQLSQSFRCHNEIARFATDIILPNKIGGEDFTGVGEGGLVQIHRSDNLNDDGYDIVKICAEIREDYIKNARRLTKDYLFLFRNNISAIPIAEELYKNGVPFRVNNYTPAYEIPVMKELCELLQLVANPTSPDYIMALRYLIPEFRAYSNVAQHPLYKICRKTLCSVFKANYQFKDALVGNDAMNLLITVQDMMNKGRPMKDLVNTLWPMYNELWLRPNEWKLEAKVEYYIRQVQCLVHKPYSVFIQDEMQKQMSIKESKLYDRGVRCYTMHASKGLEADVVYLVDVDNDIIPNVKKLDAMISKKCEIDAARALREERSLAYVACTRAKNELHIVYNHELSPILLGSDCFKAYDDLYSLYRVQGDDIRAFNNFVEEHIRL